LRKLWNTRSVFSYCLFLFSVTLWPYFSIYLLWFVRIKSLEVCFWRCAFSNKILKIIKWKIRNRKSNHGE
jgi:hypothetical protein